MKTNSKNSNMLGQTYKDAEIIFNSEMPLDVPFSGKKVINLKKKDGSSLNVKRHLLGTWIESIVEPSGVYFLDFDHSKIDNYSMHYLDHDNGKLMEINMPPIAHTGEDPKKEFLDKLIFDLNLFGSDEPIVVYGKSSFEDILNQLSELKKMEGNIRMIK